MLWLAKSIAKRHVFFLERRRISEDICSTSPVRNSSGQDKESHTTAEEGDNGIKAAIKKSQ